VTFTATVTPTVLDASNGNVEPTGMVTFKDGSTTLATVSLADSGGTATASYTPTAGQLNSLGDHFITAVYNDDTNFASSQPSASVKVTVLAVTTTAVVSTTNPTGPGQATTFTATVTNFSGIGGLPAGSVEFFDGAKDLGAGTALTPSGTGKATSTFSVVLASLGGHLIRVVYTPTGLFLGSAGSMVQTVAPVTTLVLTSDGSPSAAGQPVTFTATISNASGVGKTPTGTVQFFDGTTLLGSVPLSAASGGRVTLPARLSAGRHTIKAVYTAWGVFQTSSDTLTQIVN
jgi:hypothetical protein